MHINISSCINTAVLLFDLFAILLHTVSASLFGTLLCSAMQISADVNQPAWWSPRRPQAVLVAEWKLNGWVHTYLHMTMLKWLHQMEGRFAQEVEDKYHRFPFSIKIKFVWLYCMFSLEISLDGQQFAFVL